jgi:CHAT domain-containing protein/tetratricopeptide (TPR) repeat protein
MTPTRFFCSTALALGVAMPAHAQFDLLRKLLPPVQAVGNIGKLGNPGNPGNPFAGNKRMAALNAVVQRAGMGDLKGALPLAEALIDDDMRSVDASPQPMNVAMLRQSVAIGADLYERDGNYQRAIALYEMLAGVAQPVPAESGLPGDVAARAHIAGLQMKAGDFGAARRSYEAVLARKEIATPLAAVMLHKLHAGLGKAALRLGDDAAAETNLLLAIREDPAITEQAPPKTPGAPGFFEAMTVMNAAAGRIQDTLKSMAADNVVMDADGELVSSVTGKPVRPTTLLDVEGPLTDLAGVYYRRRDAAALSVLYHVTFGEYAARVAAADTVSLGPPAQLERQYARFGAYLAGLQRYDIAQQAFDAALRLNARRLAVAAVDVVPEQLGAFFAARREILDLAISLRLAERADAARWSATLGDLLQSKGLQSDFLARRARAIGISQDAEVRRLAAEMEAVDVAGDGGRYARRAAIAMALQQKIGKQLPPLAFRAGAEFHDALRRRLGTGAGETLLTVSVFTPFDFRSQRFGARHYLGAGVRADGIKVADLGAAETLDALGARLRADLGQRPQAGAAKAAPASAHAVYDALVKPLLGARAANGAYVADLDGALSLLPMEALADAGGRYLIEGGEWRYVGSARALLRAAPAAGPGSGAGKAIVLADPAYDQAPASAGAAPAPSGSAASTLSRSAALQSVRFAPLPQTLEEGRAVAAALQRSGAGVELRTGPDAGVQALAQLHAPRYLHIATHGFFVEEAGTWRKELTGTDGKRYLMESYAQGRSSGLALAGANRAPGAGGDGGVLYAAQLRQLDLAGTELAVLSACDTSVGAIALGEGVDSLRQALDVAGAAGMVTSLWSVPDLETRTLMTDFYDALAGGAAKAAALRQAKLHVKARQGHPYYWASFVFTGMR